MACRVIHAGQLTDSFMVKTGVRQGCLLSPFLFLLAIDWIMKTTTKNRRNGIQWTPWSQLEDLDFADDLALLSHSHKQMQEKKCEGSFVLRSGDMANHTEDTKENTDLHQQMPAQNTTLEVGRQGTEHHTLENNQATTHRK